MNIDSSIVVALITLAGVVISAFVTKSNLYSQLDKKNALIEQRLDQIDKKIESHNNYAKMFADNIPVLNEQIKIINKRLDDLEKIIR